MKTGLETRWGGGPDNPSLEEMRAALAELSTPDAEHPDTWLVDDEGWAVTVYETGLATYSDDGREVARKHGVPMDDALQLWQLLQQGRRDEIIRRLSE